MSVKDWLKNKDYQDGVNLFCELSSNDFLKNLFKSGPDNYNRKKLLEELLKLDTEEFSSLPKAVESPKPIRKNNDFLFTKINHDLQQIFRQIDSNRFALSRSKSDKSRLEYALQILTLLDKKRVMYEQKDYLEEYGELPKVKSKQKVFVTSELQRLYVQVNKMRIRLQKTDEELRNRAKSEQKLNEKLARIAVLKNGGE